MSQTPSTPTGNQPASDDGSVTVGVGGQTSGQQGATPSHESQAETGGNGGPGMTRNQSGPYVNAPDGSDRASDRSTNADVETDVDTDPATAEAAPRTEPVDAAMTHANPGAQDTRSSQAGRHASGLGTPETGGSQDERDLPPVGP